MFFIVRFALFSILRVNPFFMNHSLYGVYNAGNTTVTAENNWWGDTKGPNTSGDKTYGPLNAEPWLTQSVNGISLGDIDGDGLPDSWEFSWFGNLTMGNLDDPDNDGIPNYLEHLGETSPTLPDQKSITTMDFSHNAGGRITNLIITP